MESDRPVWRAVAATCPSCEFEATHTLDVGAVPAVSLEQCPECDEEYEVRLSVVTRPSARRRLSFERGLRLAQ